MWPFCRSKKMRKGDIVLYVCHFDADPTDGPPNVCPAMITQVNESGTLDLVVFFLNGQFYKQSCEQGTAADDANRGKWIPRD